MSDKIVSEQQKDHGASLLPAGAISEVKTETLPDSTEAPASVLEDIARELFNDGSDAYERQDHGLAKALRDKSQACSLGAACIRALAQGESEIKMKWLFKFFEDGDDLVEFLGQLAPAQALAAKVMPGKKAGYAIGGWNVFYPPVLGSGTE